VTRLEMQTGEIPRPYPGILSRPYWEGLAQGELRYQRCAVCGGATHTPAVLCAHCGSRQLSWEVSAGLGAIYSWTLVWRPQTPAFTVPYAPVVVDVDEGFQMLSNLVNCDHEDARVGLRVRLVLHELGEGVTLPYFEPAPGPSDR
jgi:uncharacterized protein